MADNKYPASDSTRNAATEDLFNQEATARINPNREMFDDLNGHNELSSEELFMQNLQGRIDHDAADNLLPTIQAEGFSFEPSLELLDSLTESGVIPTGTVLATMSVPVEGRDFSFELADERFAVMGERLVLKQDLTPQVGEEFSFAVRVSNNTSNFEVDVPVRIDFNDLAEFTQELIDESLNQASEAIELSGSGLDENSAAGTFVANLTAVDADNTEGAVFELTGAGAQLFEIVGTQLVVKGDAVLDFEDRSQLPVEITVTDASGNGYKQTVTIDLNDINETPLLDSAAFDVDEAGGVYRSELHAEDQDLNEQLTFVVEDGFEMPVGFELAADGDYSFDPANAAYDHLAQGDSQIITVPVKVIDSGGLESTAQIKITITGTNDGPVAGADVVVTGGEGDSAIAGYLGGSDVDAGIDLNYNADVTLPAGFTLDTDAGEYSFDPTDDAYNGMAVGDRQTLNIPVTVSDGDGGEALQMITITIDGTNDAPVAGANVAVDVNEGDSAISGSLGGSDVDAGTDLSYSANVDLPAGFTLDTDSGEYSFDPTDDAYSSMAVGDSQALSIPVTVSDGDGGEAQQMITITIDGTNDAPVAGANVAAEVNEGYSAISGSLGGSDVDAGTDLSYNADVTLPAGFTLDTDTGEYSFDPTDEAYDGLSSTDSIQLQVPVTVTDGDGGSAQQLITIDVQGTNDAPVAGTAVNREVNESDAVISGSLGGSDVDAGTDLTYSANVDLPAGFTLDGDTGEYSFDPTDVAYDGLSSTDSIQLQVPVIVTDGDGGSAQQRITIDVQGTNDAPVAGTAVNREVNEGDAVISGSLGGSDVDAGTDLTYSANVDLPAGFTLDGDTGEYSFDPTDVAYDSLSSTDSIQLQVPVTVTDGDGGSAQQLITIDVQGTNDAPVAMASVGNAVDENASAGTVVATLSATDVDNSETFTYGLTDSSGNFEIVGNQIQVKAGADIDFESAELHNVSVEVADSSGNTYSENFDLSVNNLNEGPTDITLAGGSVDENATGGTVVATLAAADEDNGETFTYNLTDASGNFEIVGNQIQVKSGADIDFKSAELHNVSVEVADSSGNTYSENFALSVNNLNEGPTDITLAGGSVDENATGGTAVATLATADQDTGEILTYNLSDSSGNFEIVGNQIQVKAGANIDFESSELHNVSVEVADSSGNTYSENFDLSVNNLNEGPTDITLSGGSVDENATGGTVVATLGAADQDTGEIFTYNLSDSSSNFEIVGNQIRVKAGANIDFESAELHNVSVEVIDAAGNSYSESFALSVNNLNEGPTDITLSGGSVDENSAAGTVVATLSAADEDSGEAFSYALADASDHFEIVGNEIRVKAGAEIDFESADTHSVSVQVTDSAGNSYSESFDLNVSDVEESQSGSSQYAVENTDTSGMNPIVGGTGNDKVYGTDFDDHITDPAGNDKLYGYDGDDVLEGGDGNDHLFGGNDNDTLYGGNGNDQLHGGDGRDYLSGGEGNDKIEGGSGNDYLIGGEGNDNLIGGEGDDWLVDGLGNDTITGGDGNDTFIFSSFGDDDHFSGGTGGGWTDTVQLSADADADNPWTITVDGQELEYDLAAKALELNPDTSGVVTMADGSELAFDGIEKIEW